MSLLILLFWKHKQVLWCSVEFVGVTYCGLLLGQYWKYILGLSMADFHSITAQLLVLCLCSHDICVYMTFFFQWVACEQHLA